MEEVEIKLRQLLDGYLIKIPNHAEGSDPFYVDRFLKPYLLSAYGPWNQEVKVYYFPLLKEYSIIKTVSGKEVFSATIQKDQNSNEAEILLKTIYSNLIVINTTESVEELSIEEWAERLEDFYQDNEEDYLNFSIERIQEDVKNSPMGEDSNISDSDAFKVAAGVKEIFNNK